ncbi:hypothetical protein DXF82_03155 [Enterobacter hormaechei]|uniref:hypothetical protein n=1 Tax=Enterobacter hormaechei TaxID=158836 RepID=UPI000E1CDAC1|nr:hypothetical protein [Enterobacter hormaechei]RDT10330.1 hypothetical protein DXF82_03155 [Enterobacter hormaechei]
MHRIDTSTAQKDKFGAGKNGFTDGNPQTGTQSTALNASFFDTVQEEVCAVIEDEGITLDSENNGQLLEAIKSKITTAIGGLPGAPVTSVNGKTGAVQLKAQDVGVTMDNIGTNQYALSTNGIARVIGIGGIASNNNEVTVTLGRAFPSKIVAISGSFSGNGGQDSDSWWTATVINSGSFTLRSRNASGTWSFVLTGN